MIDAPLELPEIEQVIPQVIEARPGARVLIRGRHLDRATAILVQDIEAEIRSASSGSLLFDLPDGLRAGVVTVRAVRDVLLGQPPTPHRLYESNPASFVLRPRILEPPRLDAGGERLRLRLEPEVVPEQKTALLLNQLDGDADRRPPAGYALAGERGASGSELAFNVSEVGPGTYLVRVQVDGASSALEVDHDPESPTYEQYVGPWVTFPETPRADE